MPSVTMISDTKNKMKNAGHPKKRPELSKTESEAENWQYR